MCLLHAEKGVEVVPAEQRLDQFEARTFEERLVLLGAAGNEHVIKRLAFARDLGLRIAVTPLQIRRRHRELAMSWHTDRNERAPSHEQPKSRTFGSVRVKPNG
jgi:hypothetical protein